MFKNETEDTLIDFGTWDSEPIEEMLWSFRSEFKKPRQKTTISLLSDRYITVTTKNRYMRKRLCYRST